MNSKIGANIAKYRKLNGISQKYLANRIGITPQGLAKIEKGVVNPKADTIEKVIQVLCITPNQLFGFEKIDEDNSGILTRVKRLREASGN